jgi:hypothetical protein
MTIAPAAAAAPRIWVDPGGAAVTARELFEVSAEHFAGVVCSAGEAPALGDSRAIVRVVDQNDLRVQLGGERDLFVPAPFAEALAVLQSAVAVFRGRIWLEDSYAARHAVHGQREGSGGSTLGLVGTMPPSGSAWKGVAYAYAWTTAVPLGVLVNALTRGIEHLWLSTSQPGEDLRAVLRLVSDAMDAADLVERFGGVPAEALSRQWECRLCLMVRRPLEQGHRLAAEDLYVGIGAGGLSVELKDNVVGRCVRYGLAPDTPLTFGVLEC